MALWDGSDRFFQIESWLNTIENKCVLEIGVGSGGVSKFLAKKNIVYALDIDESLLEKLEKEMLPNVHLIYADARKMPFKADFFDVIICREVIEHMSKEDGAKMLNNFKKILKTNGSLLISTPNRYSPEGIFSTILLTFVGRKWNAWDSSHKYIYNIFEFKNLLESQGFHVRCVRGEYYLFSLLQLAYDKIYFLSFLKRFRELSDKYFGFNKPFNNFGFVIEYFCEV